MNEFNGFESLNKQEGKEDLNALYDKAQNLYAQANNHLIAVAEHLKNNYIDRFDRAIDSMGDSDSTIIPSEEDKETVARLVKGIYSTEPAQLDRVAERIFNVPWMTIQNVISSRSYYDFKDMYLTPLIDTLNKIHALENPEELIQNNDKTELTGFKFYAEKIKNFLNKKSK